ncbi:MAG TPA: inorganic diphosphatase [Candidatus Baltobacteraceae bacterium]|jgi:inorganic pyrophosphatase
MKQINPTNFEAIPAFPDGKNSGERRVHAVIETPRDTRHKYAFDPKLGLFKLKLTLPEGMQWPYDYGFVPRTLADDGDPLDILVLNQIPTFTGCLLETRVLGIVRLKKNGVENDRVLAAPVVQPGVSQPSDAFADADDIPKDTMSDICRFLVEYSEEEGNRVEFKQVRSRKKAMAAIEAAMKTYEKKSK